MTNYEFRYAAHPFDSRVYGTGQLRKEFLIPKLFVKNSIQLTYSMYDRYIVGGVMPVNKSMKLEIIPYLKLENFLNRRELGVVNVGGKGKITVDGTSYELAKKEALYVGQGTKEVIFESVKGEQSLFYLNSAPAHKNFPTKKVGANKAEVIQLCDEKYANKRVLIKLIVNSIVETCQLQMGLTELLPGNICSMMSELGRNSVSAYAAAKGGLKMLTRSLATEWAKQNIQVNGICPGYFTTSQTEPIRADGHPFNEFIINRTPSAKWANPADLAGTAVFLASKSSDFVNGQIVYVDGGILATIGKPSNET